MACLLFITAGTLFSLCSPALCVERADKAMSPINVFGLGFAEGFKAFPHSEQKDAALSTREAPQ